MGLPAKLAEESGLRTHRIRITHHASPFPGAARAQRQCLVGARPKGIFRARGDPSAASNPASSFPSFLMELLLGSLLTVNDELTITNTEHTVCYWIH